MAAAAVAVAAVVVAVAAALVAASALAFGASGGLAGPAASDPPFKHASTAAHLRVVASGTRRAAPPMLLARGSENKTDCRRNQARVCLR